jgi:signal transduction histidine kinase
MMSEDRVQDADKRKQFLQIIATEAGRLTRLVNNVLDFSRGQRSPESHRRRDIDLVALTSEVCDDYRPQLEQQGFKFSCNAGDQPLIINADPDSIAQVLLNLLSNAEKYSPTTKDIEVQLNAGSTIELHILDRGTGVPAGSEQRIFEEFHRANDDLATNVTGTGLGLAIARRIARDQGGDLVHAHREGGGSIFTLILPHV